jgi:CxxC motif-containing protein (DUF1111 family)
MLLLLACATPEPRPEPTAPVADSACDVAPLTAELGAVPVAETSEDWLSRMADGETELNRAYGSSQGLGPAYIRNACAACHAGGGKGPGEVTKMVVMDGEAPSADQSALPWGHTVRPQVAGGASTPLEVPEGVDGLLVTTRIGPPLFGRGYLEAADNAEIERIEAEQAAAGVVSGRINRVAWSAVAADSEFHDYAPGDSGLIGRFGLKSRVVTVDEFVADAFLGDMSITTPLRPEELPNPDGLDDDQRSGVDVTVTRVNLAADYVRLLDIPPRAPPDPAGEQLFAEVGCDTCHVPTLRTRADYPIPPMAGVDAPVYTDLLLHDLGAEMADGQEDGDAMSGEWRTAPLIGLRLLGTYLHDGRARSLGEAIAAHGGEAGAATEAFLALTAEEKDDLCSFVGSL